MPLLLAAAAVTATSTSSAGVLVVTYLAMLTTLVNGYVIISTLYNKDQDDAALRESYARDQRIREHVNSKATTISTDAEAIIADVQERQKQYSTLITLLEQNASVSGQSREQIQVLTKNLQSNLDELVHMTCELAEKLPSSYQTLTTHTDGLAEAKTALTDSQRRFDHTLDDIDQASRQLRQTTETMRQFTLTKRNHSKPDEEIRSQNTRYKGMIEKLMHQVDTQSNTIKHLESVIARTHPRSTTNSPTKWSGPRVFKDTTADIKSPITLTPSKTHLSQ